VLDTSCCAFVLYTEEEEMIQDQKLALLFSVITPLLGLIDVVTWYAIQCIVCVLAVVTVIYCIERHAVPYAGGRVTVACIRFI